LTLRVDIRHEGERDTSRASASLVSGNYFDVLQVRALHGRTFTGDDDLPPRGVPVAVLGEAYWTRRFSRDPSVVGRTIDLNFQPFTVIGVVPAAFRGVEPPDGLPYVRDIWVPLWNLPALQPGEIMLRGRTNWVGLQAIGRLRPGVTADQARAQIGAVAAALDREYPGQRNRRVPAVLPLTAFDPRTLRGEAGLLLAVMGTSTMLVLLIACANVASLLLARACSRSREIAVRISLGAGRLRVIRQFLTESLVLSMCGTVLGLTIAQWALGAVFTAGGAEPVVWSSAPDARVVGYALLMSCIVAVVTGVIPALQASRAGVLPALKEGAGGPRVSRLRALFVGAEVAISLLLLVTTALLVRGVQHAQSIDRVMPADDLLSVSVGNSELHGYSGPRQAALMTDLERRMEALPGVTASALVNPAPFSGNRHDTKLRLADALDGPGLRVLLSNVSPSFFTAANLAIVRGRAFDRNAADEIVVNQALAARLWPDADPIGQRLMSGDYARRNHVVVGVVRDSPFVSLRLRNEPFMFEPIDPAGGGTVIARTLGPATRLALAAEAAVRDLDPSLEASVQAVSAGIDEEIGDARNGAGAAAGLGTLALLLALFGVAAVTAHAVVQRTHEIGIRMALGAGPSDATALVVRHSLRPVFGGIVVGLAGSVLVSKVIAMQLYGLSSLDPLAFGSAALFMIGAAAVAAWLPARRAARVEPMIALRAE
jgi:predicted permease